MCLFQDPIPEDDGQQTHATTQGSEVPSPPRSTAPSRPSSTPSVPSANLEAIVSEALSRRTTAARDGSSALDAASSASASGNSEERRNSITSASSFSSSASSASFTDKQNEPSSSTSMAIVFTDILSSTSLWEEQPGPMEQALDIHYVLLRKLLTDFEGFEVKSEGDSLFVTFKKASDALRWCCSVQEQLLELDWPREILAAPQARTQNDPKTGKTLWRGLRIRMGIHVGMPKARQDPTTLRTDFFGQDVNRAARISSSASGGQILVSGSAYKSMLQEASLDPLFRDFLSSMRIEDLGIFRFRGIDRPERLIQILPLHLSKRKFSAPTTEVKRYRWEIKFDDLQEIAPVTSDFEKIDFGTSNINGGGDIKRAPLPAVSACTCYEPSVNPTCICAFEEYTAEWKGIQCTFWRLKPSIRQRISEQEVERMSERFARICEARHPSIEIVLGACLHPLGTGLICERSQIGTLRNILESKEIGLDFNNMVMLIEDAARGVQYLHSEGIPHGNLTLDSLRIGRSGAIQVCCIGLCFLLSDYTDGLLKNEHSSPAGTGLASEGSPPSSSPPPLPPFYSYFSSKMDESKTAAGPSGLTSMPDLAKLLETYSSDPSWSNPQDPGGKHQQAFEKSIQEWQHSTLHSSDEPLVPPPSASGTTSRRVSLDPSQPVIIPDQGSKNTVIASQTKHKHEEQEDSGKEKMMERSRSSSAHSRGSRGSSRASWSPRSNRRASDLPKIKSESLVKDLMDFANILCQTFAVFRKGNPIRAKMACTTECDFRKICVEEPSEEIANALEAERQELQALIEIAESGKAECGSSSEDDSSVKTDAAKKKDAMLKIAANSSISSFIMEIAGSSSESSQTPKQEQPDTQLSAHHHVEHFACFRVGEQSKEAPIPNPMLPIPLDCPFQIQLFIRGLRKDPPKYSFVDVVDSLQSVVVRPELKSKKVRDLSLGFHICCLYMTEDDRVGQIANVLNAVIPRGLKVLYVALDDRQRTVTIEKLREQAKYDVDAAINSSQIEIRCSSDLSDPKAHFSSEVALPVWQKELEDALDAGFAGLQAIADMSFMGQMKLDNLVDLESCISSFFMGSPFSGLCMYNQAQFDPAELLRIIEVHPFVMIQKEEVVDSNIYFTGGGTLVAHNVKATDIKRKLSAIVRIREMASYIAELESEIEKLRSEIKDLKQDREPLGSFPQPSNAERN